VRGVTRQRAIGKGGACGKEEGASARKARGQRRKRQRGAERVRQQKKMENMCSRAAGR